MNEYLRKDVEMDLQVILRRRNELLKGFKYANENRPSMHVDLKIVLSGEQRPVCER